LTARLSGGRQVGSGWTILRVGGTELVLDWSWLLIFAFVTWTTVTSIIPFRLYGFSSTQPNLEVLLGGVVTSLLFFGSIVLHEAAHAYVAVRTGIPVRRIRLFIFGGVAEIASEPERPGQEFVITIVGPLTSAALAGAFLALSAAMPSASLLGVATGWLGQMNLILAVFNLLPGFPLDGGRLLRSGVWAVTGNLRAATRVASFAGSALGLTLIVVGVAQFLSPFRFQVLGGGIGSIWAIVIGWFLWSAARASYRDLLRREWLGAKFVRDILRHDHYPVPHDGTVAEFLDHGLADDRFGLRPVVDALGALVGVLTPEHALGVARETRAQTLVRDVADPADAGGIVAPELDLAVVLDLAERTGRRSFFVVEHGRLVGWIHVADALRGSVRRPGV
jgi:Zn-dependent protease